MNRREFLQAILAAGVAPYVSTAAGVLMPVRKRAIWLWGDGYHDDTEALQALFDGLPVKNVGLATAHNVGGHIHLSRGHFLITSTIFMASNSNSVVRDSYFKCNFQNGPAFAVGEGSKNILLHSNVILTPGHSV